MISRPSDTCYYISSVGSYRGRI
ncbi:UNVERIFIED_CONTAM: hypothetical protein GTU68_001462 [Idotea baltica]|nr:hypothetical protein [Idotea baltica]